MSYILGIEPSCDETAAAVVEDGRHVLSNIVYSQIPIHRAYGGVVPEIASRKHVEVIRHVVETALEESGISPDELSGIAVTQGPGLVGPLLVGLSFAKAYSFGLGIPLLGVHHLDGHICANYLAFSDLTPPFLALIVSGGHSHFYHVTDYGEYELLGGTRDDAKGEAFDKVARMLDLPYPGGPEVEKLALLGQDRHNFPMALLEEDSLDFSFSGMKSAIRNHLQKHPADTEAARADIAHSFQERAFDVVETKIKRAILQTEAKTLVIAGGVAANQRLRQRLSSLAIDLRFPPLKYCTDNAAMIASSGYYMLQSEKRSPLTLNAKPNLSLDNCG